MDNHNMDYLSEVSKPVYSIRNKYAFHYVTFQIKITKSF